MMLYFMIASSNRLTHLKDSKGLKSFSKNFIYLLRTYT